MPIIDLTSFEWEVRGYRPDVWRLAESLESATPFAPDVPAMKTKIPTSAQAVLLANGWLADWNKGINSLSCEWVEQRHWGFRTTIPAGTVTAGQTAILEADGLDYWGWILVDGQIVSTFKGALLRHAFDLTPALSDGKAHTLDIVFDVAPPEQGQVGFTSKSKYFKPRFNYSWDWCPRFVPVGIWDKVSLLVDPSAVEVVAARTELEEDLKTAKVFVTVAVTEVGQSLELKLAGEGGEWSATHENMAVGESVVELKATGVSAWHPNGQEAQPLYKLKATASDGAGKSTVVHEATLGFKRVTWEACKGAPAGALPWICHVNGKAVFLQGVNWTPVRMDYHSVTRAEYAKRIDMYKSIGVTVLRVWGGAMLETQDFYELCDEAGILVWQEFPLSSSGIDNNAPEDPEVIAHLCEIARDYIRRRGHHACKLLWCGGNELQTAEGKKTGVGFPNGYDHPCLAALHRVVQKEDPGVRFVPSSSSGPRFMANPKDYGKGLHHDVHGPWNIGAWEEWTDTWDRDDALFRSEVGVPGASDAALIRAYSGGQKTWPPTPETALWQHGCAWWLQLPRFKEEVEKLGSEAAKLDKYVELSQQLQAKALEYAATATRKRFPAVGGFIVWMGHDCYPCPANTAVIDFEGKAKPSFHALGRAFKTALGG